jgi:hypothetical protein
VCFRSHIEASSGLYTYLICLALPLEYSSTLYIYRLMHTYRYVSKAVCRVRAGSRCGLSVHISRGRPRYPPSSPPCVPTRAPARRCPHGASREHRAANRAPPRSGRATPTGDADYALRTRSLRTTVYALTPINIYG